MKIIIFLILSFLSINTIEAKEKVKFDSCVDGDTFHIILNNEKQTVRMLAVETPETVHTKKEKEYYGKEASEYTCNKITNAKTIELEYDKNSNKTDKYGRILAWVFVDGTLLQKDLVENGYAKLAYLYDDYKYTQTLEESQELASLNKKGIWAQEQEVPNEDNPYSVQEIIIIVILIIIIIYSSNKKITKKAKTKLKKILTSSRKK